MHPVGAPDRTEVEIQAVSSYTETIIDKIIEIKERQELTSRQAMELAASARIRRGGSAPDPYLLTLLFVDSFDEPNVC